MKPANLDMTDPWRKWLVLPARLKNILDKRGLVSIGDVCRLSPFDVLVEKGIGGTSLGRLEHALADVGLSLGTPRDTTIAPACIDCRFWERASKDPASDGQCCRFPPQHDGQHCRFPWTVGGSWCGEFVLKH